MGIVVDLSGSMQSKLRHATSAVRAITDIAGPGDEAFLMTFGDRPEMRLAANPAVDSWLHTCSRRVRVATPR